MVYLFLRVMTFVLLLPFLYPSWVIGAPELPASVVHHNLSVKIDPLNKTVFGEDTVTLQVDRGGKTLFKLRRGLKVSSLTEALSIQRIEGDRRESKGEDDMSVTYSLLLPPDSGERVTVSLKYSGKLEGKKGEVSEKGVFLSGGDLWYPRFSEGMVTFNMRVLLPEGWASVSQGERRLSLAKGGGAMAVTWESTKPTDEVLLIAGKFMEYSQEKDGIKAMAFLRTPDKELADRYIKTTFSYLEMFQNLIGPYPYKKFALVENYLPTGYGMPSLTLMGSNIIRFPFILHSSYPHELLHNWWGNGVFIDRESGNWAEGLTVYLADHLIKEGGGGGVEYRRTSLQKYTDYVNSENDISLTSFRYREGEASQAIGYGKTMMMFHMLRVKLGDREFIDSLNHFYRENIFRRASFDDIRRSFESVTGRDLNTFFNQWVVRKGAPELALTGAKSKKNADGFLLSFTLNQRSSGEGPYELDIPVAVTVEGSKEAYSKLLKLGGESMTYNLPFASRPLLLSVDPQFDIFRRLGQGERPPSLSQAFGAKKVTILLPSRASIEFQKAYRELALSFKKRGMGKLIVAMDREYKTLPEGTVWILGLENTHGERGREALEGYDADILKGEVRFGANIFKGKDKSFVSTTSRKESSCDALVWLSSATLGALPGLARKLPHYGKYSFLVFKGEEPVNIHKGVWPLLNSPMTSPVKQHDGVITPPSSGRLPARPPLIEGVKSRDSNSL